MYAVIKFTDEEKTRIVCVEDIKHFDVANINFKKKYLVKFDKDFYPAQIIVVKDTIEELEIYQKNHRLRAINKNLLESASEDSDGVRDYTDENKKATEMTKKKKAVSSSLYQTKAVKQIEGEILTNYVEQQKKENLALKTAEVDNKRAQDSEAIRQIKNLQDKNQRLKAKVENLIDQNTELTDLNIQLQKVVIDQFKTFSTQIPIKDIEPNVGEVVNDQVHLGRGVFLSKAIFNDHWSRATSGPQFVKNMAVSVFGIDNLLKCSVTGKQSNRVKTERKPPLDGTKLAAIEDIYKHYLEKKGNAVDFTKEIKSLRTYIANKIADLIRTQNRQKMGKKTCSDIENGQEVEFVNSEQNSNAEDEHQTTASNRQPDDVDASGGREEMTIIDDEEERDE